MLLSLILLSPSAAIAQKIVQVQLGAVVGAPLRYPFESNICCSAASFVRHEFEGRPYALGPSFAVTVFDRVRVQADAVQMPIKFSRIETTCCPAIETTTTRGPTWEFPLLADYNWLRGFIRPFGGGGLILGNTTPGGRNQSPAPVVNGGLEWRHGNTSIRPEFRLTFYRDNGASQQDVGRTSPQMQFLVGFMFGP